MTWRQRLADLCTRIGCWWLDRAQELDPMEMDLEQEKRVRHILDIARTLYDSQARAKEERY